MIHENLLHNSLIGPSGPPRAAAQKRRTKPNADERVEQLPARHVKQMDTQKAF